ncbi:MAG: putative RNA-binding protein containing a PIN domain [Chloroflexi bacterium]|nr:MAG: putative RNA-binding protein containing a PIN domain [Chloroflexota bacterium]
MARLIVDGMNVIGSRPTGWWRDRPGAARALLGRLQTLAALEAVSADELVLVLDGRPLPDVPEGRHDGVQVLYARRGGRDAADDRIVEEVAAGSDAGSDLVVTSDRELRRRVVELGAGVEGASALLGRLDAVEG